jgi:hypothetical protein
MCDQIRSYVSLQMDSYFYKMIVGYCSVIDSVDLSD